jgi:hypothetical protein
MYKTTNNGDGGRQLDDCSPRVVQVAGGNSVAARGEYGTAVVDPDERSAAAGVTGVARTAGASFAPVFAGPLLGGPTLGGAAFVVAGVLKLIYDGLLYKMFRALRPPEEVS